MIFECKNFENNFSQCIRARNEESKEEKQKPMAYWLGRWIANTGGPDSKPLGGSKFNSAFHPSEVDQMSNRNSWELNGNK